MIINEDIKNYYKLRMFESILIEDEENEPPKHFSVDQKRQWRRGEADFERDKQRSWKWGRRALAAMAVGGALQIGGDALDQSKAEVPSKTVQAVSNASKAAGDFTTTATLPLAAIGAAHGMGLGRNLRRRGIQL